MDRTEAINEALKIDGWLDSDEAGQLYDLAANASGPIVEIGAWKGRSTAVLARGSMAGGKQPVYSIDSFKGSGDLEIKKRFAQGDSPSAAQLRANLDGCGINGIVRIIESDSASAVDLVPGAAVLFVDGAHDYESVSRDLRLYLPRVLPGGTVACHDSTEPGVAKAITEQFAMDRRGWIERHRESTLYLAMRRSTSASYSVMLGSPGAQLGWRTVCSILALADSKHQIVTDNSGNGWDDFNSIWVNALNEAEAGNITHFAMVHSDIAPQGQWLDLFIDELERHNLDFVSAISPIKDSRGVTSSGIGDPNNRWEPWRRFTMREVCGFPETFGAADAGYPGWPLLHNTGCWACDLRNPLFFDTEADGLLKAYFDFPSRAYRDANGKFANGRESEDWYFSRKLHSLGAKTAITRKVRLSHRGSMDYTNWNPWGRYRDGDEDTAQKWRK